MAGSFHQENMRRRARYTAVFLGLIAALIIITVLNITIGNVSISGKEILRILKPSSAYIGASKVVSETLKTDISQIDRTKQSKKKTQKST